MDRNISEVEDHRQWKANGNSSSKAKTLSITSIVYQLDQFREVRDAADVEQKQYMSGEKRFHLEHGLPSTPSLSPTDTDVRVTARGAEVHP